MNGFILNNGVLQVDDNLWALLPFKKVLKRDKSREKDNALKEMLFTYYYCDIKSNYLIMDHKTRVEEIKKDIGLKDDWKIDSTIQEAMDFYESRSLTVIGKLYRNTLKAANDVSDYLALTDVLLAERDDRNKPVNDISKITMAIGKIKGIMQDLKAAEKELIKEQVETEGRMKGKQAMGLFESGLNYE